MIQVGRIVGAHGLAGAVKVRSLTDFDDRFAPGAELIVAGHPRTVEDSGPAPGAGLIVKLAGLDSRTVAESLRGEYLEVPEASLHPLPEWTWYHHQLTGLEVVTEGGRPIGTLKEVLELPANDVWVDTRDGVEHLIPASRDAVIRVSPEEGRVVVADWLFEPEDRPG
jgi:16S rRNA processing protein RimM